MQRIMFISVHGDPAEVIGSEEQGGQPTYIRDLCSILCTKYKIDIFTRKKNINEQKIVEIYPNVEVIRITAGPEEFIPKDSAFKYLDNFSINLMQWIKKNKKYYSLIHSFYWLSGFVALKLSQELGIPIVHNFCSLGLVRTKALREHPSELLDRRLTVEKSILEKAHKVIAWTKHEKTCFRNLYKTKNHNLTMIPIGVNTEIFKPLNKEIALKKTGINFQNIILFVGRINEGKGISIILRALKKVKNAFKQEFKLIVIGGDNSGIMHSQIESNEKNKIKLLASDLGLQNNVIFLGAVNREVLPYYYSLASVCVVPSLYETFGLVAIESMACGLPVIASNVGGLAYTIKDGFTGKHVLPNQPDDLANKIQEILLDPEKRNSMSINARERVLQLFELKSTVSKLDYVYKELMLIN